MHLRVHVEQQIKEKLKKHLVRVSVELCMLIGIIYFDSMGLFMHRNQRGT